MRTINFILTMLLVASSYSQELSKDSYTKAKYYSNGKIKICCLKKQITLGNYSCKNWIRFDENGNLKQFEAAKSIIIKNNELPAGSIVFLNKEGWVQSAMLFENIIFDKIKCKGFLKTSIEFYKNGNLKICFLSEDQVINEVHCKADKFHPVCFYESGKVMKCRISEDFNLKNVFFKKNSDFFQNE